MVTEVVAVAVVAVAGGVAATSAMKSNSPPNVCSNNLFPSSSSNLERGW